MSNKRKKKEKNNMEQQANADLAVSIFNGWLHRPKGRGRSLKKTRRFCCFLPWLGGRFGLPTSSHSHNTQQEKQKFLFDFSLLLKVFEFFLLPSNKRESRPQTCRSAKSVSHNFPFLFRKKRKKMAQLHTKKTSQNGRIVTTRHWIISSFFFLFFPF